MAFEEWCLRRARVSSKQHRRVSMDDKMTFFQQLASLVSSGTPLLQAVRICAEQSQSTRLSEILEDVAGRLAGGCSLQTAMAGHVGVFEEHWIALIGTGEATGKMGQVLCDLNQQVRESRETIRKITGSLIYPAVLLAVSILVIVIMLWFVVPTFAEMFAEMNAELPGITLSVMRVSDYVARYGVFAVVGLGLLAAGLRHAMQTDAGRRRIGSLALAVPVIGELMVQSAMYRFASNLGLLLKSGVPMLDTLTAVSAAFRASPVYRDAILQAQRLVAAGRPLAESLEQSQLFTTMMTNMVRVGEESAQLANVMEQTAPYYKERMNSFIAKATKLLEPCIIMIMGFTISLVLLAIYLPMFEMAGKVQ